MKREQPLWESTRDLHHACEQHPIGSMMSAGTVSEQVWCDWLGALDTIHSEIDLWVPPYVQVSGELTLDLLDMLPLKPRHTMAADCFAASLNNVERACGAAYVLIGAHRRGGQMMERSFAKAGRTLPNRHVRFHNPDAAEAFVKHLRLKGVLTEAARDTFQCLLDVMDEIQKLEDQGGISGPDAR
jgi:hypothetical protein